jgi:hypothetical protein
VLARSLKERKGNNLFLSTLMINLVGLKSRDSLEKGRKAKSLNSKLVFDSEMKFPGNTGWFAFADSANVAKRSK